MIVRRGQAFSLTVHLSDPLQSGHELALVLKQGKQLKASMQRWSHKIELRELKSLICCSIPLTFSNSFSKGLHNFNNFSCRNACAYCPSFVWDTEPFDTQSITQIKSLSNSIGDRGVTRPREHIELAFHKWPILQKMIV